MQGQIIINELLAYCTFYANCSTNDAIKEVVLKFYTDGEINTAKRMLCESNPIVLVHRDAPARKARVPAAK